MKKTNEFIMKPKVDFCFKELMADADIRRGEGSFIRTNWKYIS